MTGLAQQAYSGTRGRVQLPPGVFEAALKAEREERAKLEADAAAAAAAHLSLAMADRVIKFIETFCRVPEGKDVGKKVVLRPWQKEFIRRTYQPGMRRSILSMGRKNSKTAIAAMLVLAHLVGPAARRNTQIYSSALSLKQAGIVFNLACKMVFMSPYLNDRVKITPSGRYLFGMRTGVEYQALSAKEATAHGLSPVLVIHDELGQVRGPLHGLYDALESGMGAHEQPLSIIISTQAPTDGDLLSMIIDDAQLAPDFQALTLYTVPENLDPYDEANWPLANPALGDFRSLTEMREAAHRAQRMPSFQQQFFNLYLNRRVALRAYVFDREEWKSAGKDVDPNLLTSGRPVYCGVDLSSKRDLTALAMVVKDDDGDWHLFIRAWLPFPGVDMLGSIKEREREDRAPYGLWIQQGWLTPIHDTSIDYSQVAATIKDLDSECKLAGIAYDRWRIDELKRALSNVGVNVPMHEHGQGYKDMSPSIEGVEGLLAARTLRHGGNPLLAWCAHNAVASIDPARNRKLDKAKSSGRIDAIVAAVMAIRAALDADGSSVSPLQRRKDLGLSPLRFV